MMALVMWSDYIVSELLVDGESIQTISNSYDGSLMEKSDMEKLVLDIRKLLDTVDDETFNKFNERKRAERYEEWLEMNNGYDTSGANSTASKSRTKKKEGYVYVIKEDFSGTCKIGMTSNLVSRQKTFGVTLPFDWDFVVTYRSNSYVELEKMLHDFYSSQRVNGEWFSLSEEDVTFLRGNILEDSRFSGFIDEVILNG